MKIVIVLACAAAAFLTHASAWAGEDLMPMHPGAAYRATGRTGDRADTRSQLHVNQVRLRLPSSGPVEQRATMVEVNAARSDGSLDFSSARTVEFPSMGIPGLVSPEMLAMDYDFADIPYVESEPAAAPIRQDTGWSQPSFQAMDTFGTDAPMPSASAREPLVVEMPPPISSAANLPIPPQGGRMYEEVPGFYSSVPPVEAWSRSHLR